MKLKIYVLLALLPIVLYIVFGILFDGDHLLMLPFLLASIFFLIIFSFKNSENIKFVNCVYLIFPLLLLFVITGYLVEDYSRCLQYIIFIPMAACLAYLYLKTRKIIIIPISIVIFYCVAKFLFITIFTYLANKDAEKNISMPNITLLNASNEKIDLFRNKIIVLDFWSTTCGICFEKFPDFQSMSDKYKSNKDVEVYAVNYPLKRDKSEKTKKILDSIGYDFPKLYAKSANEIEDSLHFNTFPHLIIIKNGKIRYDGLFETEKNTMIYSIESEIKRLLDE